MGKLRDQKESEEGEIKLKKERSVKAQRVHHFFILDVHFSKVAL